MLLGETWGRQAFPAWVIGLCGDLGAGKTQLVKGLARGLQIETRVHSPSFTLLNVYEGGRFTLHHMDLYRLADVADVTSAGLESALYPNAGVTVVEWVDRWWPIKSPCTLAEGGPPVPRFLRLVSMEIVSETCRQICYADFRT